MMLLPLLLREIGKKEINDFVAVTPAAECARLQPFIVALRCAASRCVEIFVATTKSDNDCRTQCNCADAKIKSSPLLSLLLQLLLPLLLLLLLLSLQHDTASTYKRDKRQKLD